MTWRKIGHTHDGPEGERWGSGPARYGRLEFDDETGDVRFVVTHVVAENLPAQSPESLTPLELHADEDAAGNDRGAWPHVQPAPDASRPGADREALAAIVTGHEDRGISGDWDHARGKLRHCSCGWSETYPGRTDHGRGLWLDHVVALLLAARGDTAPTVMGALSALHQAEQKRISVPTFDEFDSPWQVVTRCKECQRTWPCATAIALGSEVQG